jgi:hypothetical protein
MSMRKQLGPPLSLPCGCARASTLLLVAMGHLFPPSTPLSSRIWALKISPQDGSLNFSPMSRNSNLSTFVPEFVATIECVYWTEPTATCRPHSIQQNDTIITCPRWKGSSYILWGDRINFVIFTFCYGKNCFKKKFCNY